MSRREGRLGSGFAALVAAALALAAVANAAGPAAKVRNPHGKFREDCGLCHTAADWKTAKVSAKFDHAKYGFALTGAHATIACTTCHASLDFAQARTQCAGCHADPHKGEMGSDCARCHGARSFTERAGFVRAHQLTRFPLTGGHASLDCETCHRPTASGQMQYVGTRAECRECHMAQYQAAPNHASGGFTLECQACHSTLAWTGARMDHAAFGFPLAGQHQSPPRACADCHAAGYAGTTRECYACHADTYAGASPVHTPAYFPTASASCTSCHSAAAATFSAWTGGTFPNHAWFPIASGRHAGIACMDCHAAAANLALYACAKACHTSEINSHPTVSGFSPATVETQCYVCHPQGRRG